MLFAPHILHYKRQTPSHCVSTQVQTSGWCLPHVSEGGRREKVEGKERLAEVQQVNMVFQSLPWRWDLKAHKSCSSFFFFFCSWRAGFSADCSLSPFCLNPPISHNYPILSPFMLSSFPLTPYFLFFGHFHHARAAFTPTLAVIDILFFFWSFPLLSLLIFEFHLFAQTKKEEKKKKHRHKT